MKNQITDTQVFAYLNEEKLTYSVNFAIDNKFLLQLSEDHIFSIPQSNEATWNSDEDQDYAFNNFDAAEIVKEMVIPSDIVTICTEYTPDFYGDKKAEKKIREMI